MGKCVVTDYVDFSSIIKIKGFYEHKFRAYSKRLSVKYQSLIKHVYECLIVKELRQLIQTDEEAKVYDLIFQDMCKM